MAYATSGQKSKIVVLLLIAAIHRYHHPIRLVDCKYHDDENHGIAKIHTAPIPENR